MVRIFGTFIYVGLFVANSVVFAAQVKSGSQIEMWVRKSGDYTDGHFGHDTPKKLISLEEVASKTSVQRFDLQYGKKVTYRGVSLNQLVADFKDLPSTANLLLLHFDNGMTVPLPVADLNTVDAFVARQIQIQKKWVSDFPDLPKDKEFKDPRPLKFAGNKLVVSKSWHPTVNPHERGEFTPWVYVSSLTGIEFVNETAYFNQFLVATDPLSEAGLGVFKQRCQYCHGARHVGASYGWDFVDPLPVYKQKNPENIFLHVKYPKFDAIKRGLMMPAQTSISKKEAEVLWGWMKDLAELKMKPYLP